VSKVKINKAKSNDVLQPLFRDQLLTYDTYDTAYIPDFRMKPLTKYYRPSFSPYFNSWIIDFVYYDQMYLFIINENTRFLIVYPLRNRSAKETNPAIQDFINNHHERPIHIKGDGDRTFVNTEKTFKQYRDVFFHLKEPASEVGLRLANSYVIMDVVVRTIRNLVGRMTGYNPNAFNNQEILRRVVDIYNNTVHSAFNNRFTPAQVQADILLEAMYIRCCKDKLRVVDRRRLVDGLITYEPGAILLVHIPIHKTDYAMSDKRRRNFNELAVFVGYNAGNAVVDLVNPYADMSRIVLPVYYTKYLARDINEYLQKYHDQFTIV
jgi:hypothetical protein